MFRSLLAASLILAAVSLPAAATGIAVPSLRGVVGPGFTITLSNADGTPVSHLDPGQYLISVDDQSSLHNFHLTGPGVDMSTDIAWSGPVTWDVMLTDGTYRFLCDAHPLSMKGSFGVGTAPPPSPIIPELTGKVTRRAITLTKSGTRVRSLFQGTYKFKITDASKTQNFHLIGSGVNRKTGVSATQKRTWNVKLVPGKYVYRSDKNRRLRGTITVKSTPPPG
jgi:hypothetical protein